MRGHAAVHGDVRVTPHDGGAETPVAVRVHARAVFDIPRARFYQFSVQRVRRVSRVRSVFAGPLTDADAACAESEAHLRSLLLRVRDHAESIAFCRGGAREFRNAIASLRRVAAATRARIAASRDARLFANAFEFATFAAPSLVIAPRYSGRRRVRGGHAGGLRVQNRERRVERRRRKVRGTHRARRRDGAARGARGGFFPAPATSTAYSETNPRRVDAKGTLKTLHPTTIKTTRQTTSCFHVANVSAAVPRGRDDGSARKRFLRDGDALISALRRGALCGPT